MYTRALGNVRKRKYQQNIVSSRSAEVEKIDCRVCLLGMIIL